METLITIDTVLSIIFKLVFILFFIVLIVLVLQIKNFAQQTQKDVKNKAEEVKNNIRGIGNKFNFNDTNQPMRGKITNIIKLFLIQKIMSWLFSRFQNKKA